MAERFLIWGARGHGQVVRDVILACGDEVIGFVDRNVGDGAVRTRDGRSVPVIAESDLIASRGARLPLGATALALGIGANRARWDCFGRAPAARWPARVHPSVVVGAGVSIGDGTIAMPGVVINAGARIGRACILNSSSVVEHDCTIGDAVHLSPGAVLCGYAKVGQLGWIGAGATVIPGVSIGDHVIVGAGSAVVADVVGPATVVGCPARPVLSS